MTERPMAVEVVDAEQLDAGLDRREQSALDLNPLRRQRVGDRSALHPEDQVTDADGDDDEDPLAQRGDDRGMTGEELTLDTR
jgi:hypothetical protein